MFTISSIVNIIVLEMSAAGFRLPSIEPESIIIGATVYLCKSKNITHCCAGYFEGML